MLRDFILSINHGIWLQQLLISIWACKKIITAQSSTPTQVLLLDIEMKCKERIYGGMDWFQVTCPAITWHEVKHGLALDSSQKKYHKNLAKIGLHLKCLALIHMSPDDGDPIPQPILLTSAKHG